MTPQERAGMASAITEAIAAGCTVVREACAHQLEAVQRSAEERIAELTQRVELLTRDLDATRTIADAPALRDVLIDSDGALRIVQRNGETLTAPLAALPAIAAAAVDRCFAEAEPRLSARLDAQVARHAMRMGDAPRWSSMAFYGPGAVVSCYSGRTYELREGIASSMSQEPGEHPDIWSRIGSHGLRVLKSKPATLQPGDTYAEDESRFITDGETTTLLVPKGVKASELKPIVAQLRANTEQAGSARRDIDGLRTDLRLVSPVARLAPIVDALEQLAREEFR